jgi:hypothetical protein
MEKVSNVEQAEGSDMMMIFTESGHIMPVSQKRIEQFIIDNGMNIETRVSGNDSPLGDGDPAYDIEEDVETPASDYLDSFLYEACELYVNTIRINHILKRVA